jgi:hypothetical protein
MRSLSIGCNYSIITTTTEKPGYPTNQREEEFAWLGFGEI